MELVQKKLTSYFQLEESDFLDYFYEMESEHPSVLDIAQHFSAHFVEQTLKLVVDRSDLDITVSYVAKEDIIEAFEELDKGNEEKLDDIITSLLEVLGNSTSFENAIVDALSENKNLNFESLFVQEIIRLAAQLNYSLVTIEDYYLAPPDLPLYVNPPITTIW